MKKSFTLIEVMLACTVLILFLTSGIILFGTGMRNVVIAKHRLEATYLANQKIEDLTSTRDSNFFAGSFTLPTNGSCSDAGPIPQDGVNFTRTCTISDGPFGAADSKKITVTLTWREFDQDYSTISYKYLTKWQN